MSGETKASWTRLFAQHHASLSGFFRRRVADQGDAEDLAQEVYLRLLRADGDGRGTIRNPEAYLYTVAVNLAGEHAALRRRAPFNAEDVDRLAEQLASDECAEDDVDRERRMQRLADVIERLPPKPRAVLVMQYRDGLSYREIAAHLGVSVHMVKKHVVKALALCRLSLADQERT